MPRGEFLRAVRARDVAAVLGSGPSAEERAAFERAFARVEQNLDRFVTLGELHVRWEQSSQATEGSE